MADDVQEVSQLDLKIRGLMAWAKETGLNDFGTIRGLARVCGISNSTLTSSMRAERISIANQNALAKAFGFQVEWPEWRGTAKGFLNRFRVHKTTAARQGTTKPHNDRLAVESVAPKPRLAAELERIAESAQKVIDELGKTNFKDEKFPKLRVIEIAATLINLPGGSEDGALPALEYAEAALTDVRFLFVEIAEGDELPDVPRGGRVDQSLQTLISDISTAKRFYSQRRLDAAAKSELPDHALALNSPQQQTLKEQVQAISNQGFELAGKLDEVAETLATKGDPEHVNSENLSRKSRDVATLTKQEAIEVGADRPRIAWLEKLDRGVEVALRGVELAAGVGEITVRKIGEVLINHVTDWLKAAREGAEEARAFITRQKEAWRQEIGGHKSTRRNTVFADLSNFHDAFKDGLGAGPELVVVPLGEFLMGSDYRERNSTSADRADPDELVPQQGKHRVRFARRFALGRCPVTFEEYEVFLMATKHPHKRSKSAGPSRGEHPVTDVSWSDAQEYCRWLNAMTGLGGDLSYRLPSEAEWEYACRAGTWTRRWWGDQWDTSRANGDNFYGGTTSVRQFEENPWGFNDIIGNVWEWVQDSWHNDYHGAPVDGAAWETRGVKERVNRGGSWSSRPKYLRSASRNWSADHAVGNIGFRVARALAR